MPKRKSNLNGKARAKAARVNRAAETPDERSVRLAENAERARNLRAIEAPDERSNRLAENAERARTSRAIETPDERSNRLAENAERARSLRAIEAPDERSRRLTGNSNRHIATRAAETLTRLEARLLEQAERTRQLTRAKRIKELMETRSCAVGKEIDEEIFQPHDCGLMNLRCSFCGSYNFAAEKPADGKFNNCCHKGNVVLDPLKPMPEYIKQLLTGTDSICKQFKQLIRTYNSALSFSSMKYESSVPQTPGIYCFRIHGQIHHLVSDLHPKASDTPKFAQLYIYDSNEATNQRMNNAFNFDCNRAIMQRLDEEIRKVSPYVEAYRMLHEVETAEKEKARRENRQQRPITMWIKQTKDKAKGMDKRRYNAPASNEVAVVFFNEDGEPPYERDIRNYPRAENAPSTSSALPRTFEQLNVISPNREPMSYALLFPNGDFGWKPNMPYSGLNPGRKRENISMLQFCSYRLAVRDEFNPILNAGRLTQQFMVDMYVKIESHRLLWNKLNQAKLRVDLYSGLMDHVNNRAEEEGLLAGKLIILPSSFPGSPRAMQQNYQDGMAIVREFGKPDLFITFTCNPKWKEITDNLFPGQSAEDRPDLVARVFNIKMNELLDDLKNKHVLGEPAAILYVIEFQKRGLPHGHILLILKSEYKIRDKDDIDKIVSARIPDSEKNPELHRIVKTCMAHGPCGIINPNAPCMENGKCTKGYPKDFSEETVENENGYPSYARPDDKVTIEVTRGSSVYLVDNRWIVPFNAWLLLKYGAHINVEICSSVRAVKYLFKYVYKGHDCAIIEIIENRLNSGTLVWDEIQSYFNARYVSAPEAVWRIFEYNMHWQSHTIYRLAVHTENNQSVCFLEGSEERALANAERKDTTLLGWFKLNATDAQANQYLYTELAKHYVWDQTKYEWKTRQRGGEKIISRMYAVKPLDRERFFLRLLLLHVRGACSFADIRTFNGIIYDTYLEAAKARSLVPDDDEWEKCIADAAFYQMPRQLRELFATLLIFCDVYNAAVLWAKYDDDFIEDFVYQGYSIEDAKNKALHDIEQTLKVHGVCCTDFKLPIPDLSNITEPEGIQAAVPDIVNEQLENIDDLIAKLNPEQKLAFDTIVTAVEENTGKCVFLEGPGGSGKTFVYNVAMRFLEERGKTVQASAFTGIAANLLRNGRTCHSMFGLPLKIFENSVSWILPNSKAAKQLAATDLFIFDECTMLNVHSLKVIDRLLREATRIDKPFGGKVMLVGGDWKQTLPVLPHATKTQIMEIVLKQSSLWDQFTRIELKTNMRANANEIEFANWLLKLGAGELTNDYNLGDDTIEIPSQMICKTTLIKEIFGTHISKDDPSLESKAILTPLNEDCFVLNEKVLDLMDGESRTYYSVDDVDLSDDRADDIVNYTVEMLNADTPSGFPPHELRLKVGAIVMLLRNINSKKGMCNGTRLRIEKMHDNLLEAKILTGNAKGQHVLIPRIVLTETDENMPFRLKRRQFPVRLAFVMTINKSQGQSFDFVGIFLPKSVFTHGQLYVAFSRARSQEKCKVEILKTNSQGKLVRNCQKVFTKNVVFKEILTNPSN